MKGPALHRQNYVTSPQLTNRVSQKPQLTKKRVFFKRTISSRSISVDKLLCKKYSRWYEFS